MAVSASSIVTRSPSHAGSGQSTSSTDPTEAGLSRKDAISAPLPFGGDIKDRVKTVIIDRMKAICADSNARLAGYSEKPALLDSGIFYAHDYFKALKSIGETGAKRFTFLFEQGAFFHGLAPKDFFSIKKSYPDHHEHGYHHTGKVVYGYEIKKGVSASDALKAMINGLTFLDCGLVCFLSYYYAIFELLGEERFNLLFADFTFEINNSENPLTKVIQESRAESDELDKAQLVHVKNMAGYGHKHPCEPAQGYNVLCLDKGYAQEILFLGFGLSESGVSYEEIKAKLLSEFNAPTMAYDILHEKYQANIHRTVSMRARELDHVKATKQDFTANEGGRIFSSVDLDFARLDLLARASTNEKALQLFQRMNSRAF